MSYLADTAVYAKPSGSYGYLGQLVHIAPDPPNPETVINVRLSNGTSFYTAGGTTVSGGAVLTGDQGAPNLLSAAWPVKLSDGNALFGTSTNPLFFRLFSGSVGAVPDTPVFVTGSVYIINTQAGGQNATVTNLTASSDSQLFLAPNVNRRGAIIANDSPENLYVKFGAVASSISYTYRVPPGGTLELPMGSTTPFYLGRIDGAWQLTTGSAMVTEVTV